MDRCADLHGVRTSVTRRLCMTSTTPPKPSSILPVCSAPDVRTPPEFRVPFRHPFSVKKVFEVFPPNPDQSSPPSPELACVAVPQLDVQATFDARFEQVWTLQKLAVGDLASTMSLAPLERSEEHTSELQSHHDLVCRLLLEKKNKIQYSPLTQKQKQNKQQYQ